MVAHVPKNIDKVLVITKGEHYWHLQYLTNFKKQEKMIENLPVPSQNNWADTSLH